MAAFHNSYNLLLVHLPALVNLQNMKSAVYVLTLLAFMAVVTFSSPIFAQENVNAPNVNPGTQPGISDGSSVGAATNNGFNVLWLLPLIALPVLLYLLWPRRETDEISDTSYQNE